MALLHALIRTARMLRHTPALADVLPADETVLLDAPDDRLGPALVAAGQGDHGPAAKLLAVTRESAEWENRDRYTMRLAAFARSRREWFEHWQYTAPNDPDAQLVRAELAVTRAWESPARAELLHELSPLITAAAEGDPRDPVPWRIALDRARGTGAPHSVFEDLWAEAVRRSSHHYGCHVAALQYLVADGAGYPGDASRRPRGSFRECFDFAERAAQDALPGSLVKALPVRAAFACLTADGATDAASPDPRQGVRDVGIPRARLDAAADLAIVLSAEYVVADPWLAEARNLLVYVLVRLDRFDDALEQLRRIGPYATSFPWERMSDDPLGRFLQLRDGVRGEVAAAMPLRTRRGRGRPADH